MDFSRLDLTQNLHIYAVALVTWIGVFLYLLRLERLTRDLEREVERAVRQREDQR